MPGEWEDVDSNGWEDVPVPGGDTSLVHEKGYSDFDPDRLLKPSEFRLAKMRQKEAEKMGVGEAMLTGAGREFTKLGAGIADIADMALEKVGTSGTRDDATQRRAERAKEQVELDRLYKPISKASPVSSVTGSALPYLATLPLGMTSAGRPMASAATHIANPTGAKAMMEGAKGFGKIAGKGALEGGLLGGAHYDIGAGEGASFGAGGALIGKAVANALTGNKIKLNKVESDIVKDAKDFGLYVPSGMGTGNRTLQQVDQALQTHPLTSQKVANRLEQSKHKENALIANEMGGPHADVLSPDYLASQRNRIGSDLDELAEGSSGKFSTQSAIKIHKLINDFKGTDPGNASRPLLDSHRDRVVKMVQNDEPLTGSKYQDMTSKLNRAASKQFGPGGDPDLGRALTGIADVYNDAIGTGLPSDAIKRWKKARKEYALLSAVEDTMLKTNKKGESGVSGYVDSDKLARKFKNSNTINKLGRIERLRKSQPGASLGTSQLVKKMYETSNPVSASMGAGSLLGAEITRGLGPISGGLTNLYLSGYPHITGLLPFLGNRGNKAIQDSSARLMATSEDD